MFGGTKPTFGATTSTGTGFGSFNTTGTAFGQSAFGKPATAFGAAPSFGAQQTTPSLFGTQAAQAQPTNLFGATSTSGGFGFSQPQQNTSIFASTQPTANTTSLFGQPATSAFGTTVKPAGLGGFGQPAQPAQPATTSLFGQPAASTAATGFGAFGQQSTTTVFGSGSTSAFGQPAATPGTNQGTSIYKYQPTVGTDTLMKGGQANNISTKQHCITAMKEYEAKSLEELRLEDYLANRKGPQAGTSASTGFFPATQQSAGGLFGATQPQTTGLFGQPATGATENKGLFGSSAFGQPTTSAFGTNTQQSSFLGKPFGQPTTGAFGSTTTDSANLFGAKPAFGQTTTPLFGQPATSTAPAFGQTNTAFTGFGTSAPGTQPAPLFGAQTSNANTTFGLGSSTTTNTGFAGFGSTATSTANTNLFGAKPTTGFGAAPAFGATSTAQTGFTNFSMGNTSGGFLNTTMNKPATSGFGAFGTQTSTAPLNFNTGSSGSSLFANTASKPGGLFGTSLGQNTNPSGGSGLFGTTGFGTGTTMGGGSFGMGSLGGANNNLGGGMGTAQQQTVPIHQQILSKVSSPYGDNPIFKDLKRSDETDTSRATNPAAQKLIIESTTHQFKIAAKPSPVGVKVKPLGSALTKKSLFEGLEELDSSVESFTLKPNAKRLIIKPKANPSMIGGGTANTSPNNSMGSSQLNGTIGLDVASKRGGNTSLNDSALRNESFSGEIPLQPPSSSATGSGTATTVANATTAGKEADSSRRESWLHPNNLEKVRQHNLQTDENASPLNTTVTDLVPRKPLETYRPLAGGNARLSVSTVPENPFEDQSSMASRRDTSVTATSAHVESGNESLLSGRSYGGAEDRSNLADLVEYDEHPTGITLKRVGYYTIPSMDDLKSYLAEDGSCVVPNFTVGREGYGNVHFGREIDVANLPLDEIVHFRNKEVIIYPDDDNKPPIGEGLNREAQVTLDQVWPLDKTKHEPIKDAQRLLEMDWEGKLRRACDKNDTRFIEYRPETGSWVFRVKHFSKYGLSDSDEEENLPTDPKKAKMAVMGVVGVAAAGSFAGKAGDKITMTALKNAQKISEDAARSLDPKLMASGISDFYPMDDSAEYMLLDKSQYLNGPDAIYDVQANYPNFTSPTAILAKDAGTDAHKLQLMKASFFVDMENENKSDSSLLQNTPNFNRNRAYGMDQDHELLYHPTSHSLWKDVPYRSSGVALGMSESSSQIDFGIVGSPALRPSSSVSLASIRREATTETSSPAPGSASTVPLAAIKKTPQLILKPKVAPMRGIPAVQVPFSKSISFPLRGKWPADLGLYNARRFKLTFGPQNTLIVPSTRNNLRDAEIKNVDLYDASDRIFMPRGPSDYSPTVLQLVQIRGTHRCKNFKKSIVDHLKIQLRNALPQEVEDSECPWIKPDGGTDLIVKHLEEAVRLMHLGQFEEYAVSVWSLCLALWGDQEELESHGPTSHIAVMCRRSLLSDWLENTLTDKDLLTKNITKHSYLDQLIDLVMCHKVTEACELAFRYGDANLALLLAQLSSGPVVRQLMEDQLADWHRDKADKFIQEERLKLLMLVSGVALMSSAHGPINVVEGLEWIKVLALQLWYICSPTASVTDALLAYDKAFQAEEFAARPPTPPYLAKARVTSERAIYDLRYHLLQLFSKRSHPLEKLLNPATHTADPMDYRLSWLLQQTLEALGYHHLSKLSANHLHVGLAAQLENNDLWEWAIFVLLHITDRNQRELAVQNVLYRYVDVSKNVALSEREKFVINNLGVPEKWIDYAKAVKAGSLGNHHMQAKYLLKAKQWPLAHEIIFQHIAPDAVISDNLDYLYNLLSQFEGPEHNKSVKVPNWSNQGQIFLDFIDINEKFKGLKVLKSEADIEAHWENLKPQLADLCSRINLLPCPTAKHRLCQSEIAQNLACLVRGVLLVCPVLNPCLIIKIALERLPLPQEFAQQELRALLDTLVEDVSKATTVTTNASGDFTRHNALLTAK